MGTSEQNNADILMCIIYLIFHFQTDDYFWVVVLAPSPAKVELRSQPYETTPTICHVTPGYSKLKHRLAEGGSMFVRVTCLESGRVVVDYEAENFCFTAQPKTYNFNAYVAVCPNK